ncbi:exocyst complex component 6-like [Schistocerca gregaria]|uniref:exocyst complex component 6-like n=1 Tax=Schistocerca gregaria TaxID=7010 RepID=UPI00211DE51E|nr:exocyst complex component 6-like [Schistocerca gregaria]
MVSKADVNMLWEVANNKLKFLLQVELAYCENLEVFPELQKFLFVFARTMRKYGYDVSGLNEFARASLQARYFETVYTHVTKQVASLIADPAMIRPLVFRSESHYGQVYKDYQLEGFVDGSQRSFSFGMLVPSVILTFKKTASDLFENFSGSFAGAESELVGQLGNILNGIAKAFERVERQADRLVEYEVQRYMNLYSLKKMLPQFEAYVRQLDAEVRVEFDERNIEEIIKNLEKRIYEANRQRVREEFGRFIATCQYQGGKVTGPHAHVRRVLEELGEVFPKSSVVPGHMLELIYINQYSQVAEEMMNLLLTERCQHFDAAFVESMSRDLAYIREVAKKAPIGSLYEYFEEVSQIVKLLLQPDPLVFLNPEVRMTSYSKVLSDKKLVQILKKYKESVKFGVFGRSKKRRAVIKELIARLS